MQRFGLGLGLGRGCLTIIGGGAPGNGDGEEGPANILLITDDTTHAAATNTQAAMEAGGHTVTAETTSNIDAAYDFSGYDVIALCRATVGSELTHVRAAMDAGKPCLVGSTTAGEGSGVTGLSTALDLTGTIRVVDRSPGYSAEDITDNTHEITDAFSLGDVEMVTDPNWGFALDDAASYVGDELAVAGSTSNANIVGDTTLIAIEAGTDDLESASLAARVVVWLNLYGGQGDYNANGEALVDACLQWLTS